MLSFLFWVIFLTNSPFFACLDSTHLPFGRPAVMFDTQYSLLHHVEFISGYSKELAMPLWTAYTLLRQVHKHSFIVANFTVSFLHLITLSLWVSACKTLS